MTRRMSCSMTVDAVKDRTKTVTRRHPDTWRNLKPGDRLTLIEKGMGLPKGAKQVVLAEVEVVDVRVEPIGLVVDDVRYGRQEVQLEGLGHMTPDEFVRFWCSGHGVPTPLAAFNLGVDRPMCRRIEWRYLDDQFSPVEPHQSTVAPGDEPGPRSRPGAGLTDRNEGSEA